MIDPNKPFEEPKRKEEESVRRPEPEEIVKQLTIEEQCEKYGIPKPGSLRRKA